MAFTLMHQIGSSGVRALYNVDWAVEYGGPCYKDDTMLVQALLHIFYYEQDGRMPFDSPVHLARPANYSSITVDGLIGRETRAHIDAFQDGLRRVGWKMRVDHRMDPMRDNVSTVSTIQRHVYSISRLNVACNNNDVEGGTRHFMDLRWREDMPSLLRDALKTEKRGAAQYSASGASMKAGGSGA